jgi:hypothetical protein
MPYPRLCSQTVLWAAFALALAGTCASAQAPRPGQLTPGPGQAGPPGGPRGPGAGPPGGQQAPQVAPPKPYKPVTVTMPQANGDPSFEAFRKQIADVASRKDRAGLAKLLTNTFFWMGEKGDKANKRKSAIDNLAAAIDLDGKDGAGWEILTEAANETTLEAVPDRKGVMCSPATPTYDQKAAAQNAKATGTDFGDWGFPTKGSVDVHAAAQASAPVIEKLGSVLVRVMPDEPAGGAQGNAPPPGATFVRVVTPSGKVGYVPDEALASLDVDQLCYVKDAAGWKITGYAGGSN